MKYEIKMTRETTKTIEQLIPHYENYRIRFKGDKNWYFFDIDKLKGLKIKGRIVKKRVRTWFE